MGDELWFYVSGRSGAPKGSNKQGSCVTGLATLRRDGFASMEAGAEAGTLTTRPLSFSGKHLFVNLDAPQGELRVELLDGEKVVHATSALKGDSTRLAVADVSAFSGTPLRFRFHLKNGKLYAFWVSADAKGASGGYVAAGGPGFAGPVDK